MMISPGSFYDEIKDKSAEEIKTEIRQLKRLEFEIGGFFGGWEKYVIEIDGNSLKRDTIMVLSDLDDLEVETREALLEYLQDMHLKEWRKDYSPERYGVSILDGTQWSLKLTYDDRKTREYAGDNVYPWNFGELCRLFGFEWNRYN